MAYESGFDEDPVIELKFLVEVVGEDCDEVDSLSKQVIDFETGPALPRYVVHKSFFPQRETPLEFHGEKEATKRMKKVSDKQLQKFRKEVGDLRSAVLALLTVESPLDEDGLSRVPSFLRSVCHNGQFKVLHHKLNHVVVHMDSQAAFTTIGEKIVENSGLNVIENKRIMGLEALCTDNVPNYFLEMSTPRASGQEIQSQFSLALVTFCGAFKYLRLHEDDDQMVSCDPADQRPSYPSISFTLMFIRMAQGNASRLEAILRSDAGAWRACQSPDVVRASDEKLFSLKDHAGPLLGLKSGCPLPGVRISVTFSQNLAEMERFYQIVTGVRPAPREDPRSGTSYRIYPIARNFELQLVYNSSVHAEQLKNLRICIRIADHQRITAELRQPLSLIDADHWETFDPVGNRVMLFNVVD